MPDLEGIAIREGLKIPHFGKLVLRENAIESVAKLNITLMAQLAIDAKYESLGGESGWLGSPRGEMTACADRVGYFRHYAFGSIFWRARTGAFELHGAIRDKWFALGSEASLLGYPLSDELDRGSGSPGRFQNFQHGSIFWTQGTGAHEVHGAIREKWSVLGQERGFLGNPLTDETAAVDGIGRFSEFERGSIFWSPGTGAFEVHGAIRDRWIGLGRETSFLGYPVSDEFTGPDGTRRSTFQRGRIKWSAATGTQVEAEMVVLRSVEIKASTVTGWAEIGLSSDGHWWYRGHVRQSGYTGDNYVFAGAVTLGDAAGQALFFSAKGAVGGKLNVDPSNEEWHQNGYNPLIREHWEELRSHGATFTLKVGSNLFQLFEASLYAGIAIVGVGVLIYMGGTTKWDCKGIYGGERDGVYAGIRCDGPHE